MKKIFALLLILVLAVSLVTACGGTDTPPADPNGEANPPATDGATPSTNDGVRQIRMAASGDPKTDPATGSNWMHTYCFVNLYDSLMTYDQNAQVVPQIAESYSLSEDSLVYTFVLKQGLKFHDGSEVEAKDVKFTYERLMNMNEGYAYMFKGYVDHVEVIDTHTVAFHLTKALGNFLHRVTRLYIMNEDLIMANLNMNHGTYNYGDYGDYGRDFLLTNDAGSGAYQLKELSAQNHISGEMFADYHVPFGENAPTEFKIINNTEAATIRAMMSSRELELSDNWETAEAYAALAKIEGVTVSQYSDAAMQMIGINNSLAPTDDVNVRRAIACLIDYDSLTRNIFPDSQRAIGPANANVAGSATAHSENPYSYDVEQAKAYLAQSKYAGQLDQYPIEFFVSSGVASQEKIALMLQSAAKEAGLTINVTSAPYATWVERVQSAETTANLSTSSQAPYYFEMGAILEAHFTQSSMGKTTNPTWNVDPTLEQMIADAAGLVDSEARYAAYAEIEQYVLDQCVWIFLADLTEKVAYQSDYIYWPAAAQYEETGTMNSNELGYHYWFHDFQILP